jgi:uncharacterized protein
MLTIAINILQPILLLIKTSQMPTVLITGGTGMIGKRLSQLLVEKNYDVIVLRRNNQSSIENHQSKISYANWNVEKSLIDKDAIAKADFIIHLAGANVAEKRWTEKRKKEIVESRTKSSALIIDALKNFENKVETIVSASAVGWYGEDNDESLKDGFKENAIPAKDFLAETCRLWEESVHPVEAFGKRLVKLRTGIVLSNEGGAITEFKKPLKAGVAAILGNGKQMISWIHVDDICRMYIYAMENENVRGSYNAVAPKPVNNKTLTIELAKKISGKNFISMHVPAFVLKIMLGEMSIEVLKGATVSCDKIKDAGFTFLYPSIESALQPLATQKLKPKMP